MELRDFIDVDFIALNAKHVSGALVAILGFSLVKYVAEQVIGTGWVLGLIHIADNIVVTSCIVFLTVAIVWELVRKLDKLRKGQGNGIAFSIMAA